MPEQTVEQALKSYLARVRSHLPLGQARDILRELESSIHDRLEHTATSAGREPDGAMLALVLAEVGEPEEVAQRYLQPRYLVAPENFRTFLFWTGVTIFVHLAAIGIATTLKQPLQLGPLGVGPVGPHGFVSFASSVVHAVLVDVGLVVLLFAGAEASRRTIRPWTSGIGIEGTPRAAAGRALLAVLVAVVLNFFHDRLFVVRTMESESEVVVLRPLLTQQFHSVLPIITALLVTGALKDILYLMRGERRLTLMCDAVHGVAGVAAMIYLLSTGPLLELPSVEMFEPIAGAVDNFLQQLTDLLLGFLALLFAVKTLRRLVRAVQV